MRCGMSAGCLVDLQTRAAGIQKPAGDFFFFQSIFVKGKQDKQMDAVVKQDVISVFCNSDPGAGLHPDPGLNSAAPIGRVASVLPTHDPVGSVFHRRS